ncbi:hypothetical protein OPT61_g9752 [Boeremia exigua]|uniref:Uncharacterized protein n=1 Tax=Boeremia exigua TaxID=749465 RepID=A0ACC2HT37_9PLEO|nr:hypothetical protein OPT61_g9752 [Boeremia exigua]
MTTISSLPVEIQRQCLYYLDGAALKSIRLASRAFRDITTEVLFGVATLRVTEAGAVDFTSLIKNATFRRCIRTLELGTESETYHSYGECGAIGTPEWLEEAVSEWGSMALSNLRHLKLDASYACANDQCDGLETAFQTFISHGNINTLTIKHLQDFCDVSKFDPARKPQKLHLLITTYSYDPSPDMDIELDARHRLFNSRLNKIWLNPMQSQLTHLTVHCNTYWGVYPRWQPSRLQFPVLKSLALGKWTIAFDWQIEFLTSLGEKLEQLILTDCPILHASRMTRRQLDNAWQVPLPGTGRGKPWTANLFFDLRWYDVLPDLERKLPKLKHFSMGRGAVGRCCYGEADLSAEEAFEDRYALTPRIDSSRYAIFDFGRGALEYEVANPGPGERNPGDTWWWMKKEADEYVKAKIRYPDYLAANLAANLAIQPPPSPPHLQHADPHSPALHNTVPIPSPSLYPNQQNTADPLRLPRLGVPPDPRSRARIRIRNEWGRRELARRGEARRVEATADADTDTDTDVHADGGANGVGDRGLGAGDVVAKVEDEGAAVLAGGDDAAVVALGGQDPAGGPVLVDGVGGAGFVVGDLDALVV